MTKFGYKFNYNHHKKWLLFPTAASSFTIYLLAFFAHMAFQLPLGTIINVIFYMYTVILCESQLTIFRTYIFLLVNTLIRFRQLNQCMR